MDSDPWGLPYKIVMKKLNVRRNIPGINIPGRLGGIIDALYPPGRDIQSSQANRLTDTTDFIEVSEKEFKAVARALPEGKAPGPDGMPNEVLKIAVETDPRRFVCMYNKCIKQSYYPKNWKKGNLVLRENLWKILRHIARYVC